MPASWGKIGKKLRKKGIDQTIDTKVLCFNCLSYRYLHLHASHWAILHRKTIRTFCLLSILGLIHDCEFYHLALLIWFRHQPWSREFQHQSLPEVAFHVSVPFHISSGVFGSIETKNALGLVYTLCTSFFKFSSRCRVKPKLANSSHLKQQYFKNPLENKKVF